MHACKNENRFRSESDRSFRFLVQNSACRNKVYFSVSSLIKIEQTYSFSCQEVAFKFAAYQAPDELYRV